MVLRFGHASEGAVVPALLDVDQNGRPAAASSGHGDAQEIGSQPRHPQYDDLTGDAEPAVIKFADEYASLWLSSSQVVNQ